MALYHFSENPDIRRFTPKAPNHHPDAKPMVWAIDEWHSPLYLFPSDCPRVCFWPLTTTSTSDLDRYWLDPSLRMIIAIEARWLPALVEAQIYRYELPDESFIDCHDHGVFVSEGDVTPVGVEPLRPLIQELAESEVELRLCPSLAAIANQMMTTTLHWSLIRMKFAEGWNAETGTPTMPRPVTKLEAN
jgi:hypothetical protein